MDASKTYQDLFKVFKTAHPSLKPSEIQMKVNSKWTVFKKEVKEGNDKNFNDEMNALKVKVARLKSGSYLCKSSTLFGKKVGLLKGQTSFMKYSLTWQKTSAKEVREQEENVKGQCVGLH
ncbi:hypothetical protein PoB_007388600, partial [Plakobranchus ocellatus]